MASLKAGDSFPEGVVFSYIPYTEEKGDITSCGIPVNYDASKGLFLSSPFPLRFQFRAPGSFLSLLKLPNRTRLCNADKGFKSEFANKKVVLFSVPGAFTPGCSVKHLPGFIKHLSELKSKGVDIVACIAYNDAFVMSAWGKANGIKDDSIVSSFPSSVASTPLRRPFFPFQHA
jgi:alkyl hydroperoxide reductase 1